MATTPPFLIVRAQFFVSVGNHGSTVRATYTVPTGKRARLSQGYIFFLEFTAIAGLPIAGAGSEIAVRIAATNIIILSSLNQIGERYVMFNDIPLASGETIDIITRNATATVANYEGNLTIEEYQ